MVPTTLKIESFYHIKQKIAFNILAPRYNALTAATFSSPRNSQTSVSFDSILICSAESKRSPKIVFSFSSTVRSFGQITSSFYRCQCDALYFWTNRDFLNESDTEHLWKRFRMSQRKSLQHQQIFNFQDMTFVSRCWWLSDVLLCSPFFEVFMPIVKIFLWHNLII